MARAGARCLAGGARRALRLLCLLPGRRAGLADAERERAGEMMRINGRRDENFCRRTAPHPCIRDRTVRWCPAAGVFLTAVLMPTLVSPRGDGRLMHADGVGPAGSSRSIPAGR